MATTEILPFATGGGANVVTQAVYAADPTTGTGFAAGIAASNKLNKVWRQSAFMAAGLANWMVAQGISVPDDANLSNLVAEINQAMAAFINAGTSAWAVAGGAADAITADYEPEVTALTDGLILGFRAGAANATTTPTFAPDGLAAHTIVKAGGGALVAGNIAGQYAEYLVRYNLANTRWELLNPTFVAAVAPFSKSYTSPAQVITLAGALTLAHGLSAMPILLQARYVCQADELGYTAGDEVMIGMDGYLTSGAIICYSGVGSVVPDATNLNIRYNSIVMNLSRKDNGVPTNIDQTKWKMVIRAWA